MKNAFIVAMFIFWGIVVAGISASYVVKQNRIALESIQKEARTSGSVTKSAAGESVRKVPVKQQEVQALTPSDVTTQPVTNKMPVSPSIKEATPIKINSSSDITLDVVAKHSTQADCWVVINGDVYSVASYIPMHPGGSQRIVNKCGGDATSVFEGSGGKGSHRHSSYAKSLLGSYLVGPLK